jgi:hypothetical protein
MSSYGEYIFTLGENNERTYKGSRLRVVEGLRFFGKVSTELAKVIAAPSKDINLEGLQAPGSDTKMLSFLLNCLSSIDSDMYMDFLKVITSKTVISARSGTDQVKYLTTENEINDWFTQYPSDLLPFSFKAIFENVAPFLPEKRQKAVRAYMALLEGIQFG